MFKYLVLLLLLLSTTTILAQTDSLSRDTLKFSNNIGISGYWNKTNNNNILLYTMNYNSSLSNKKNSLNFNVNYIRGTNNDTTLTNNDVNTNLNINLRKDKRIYYWFSSQYDNSYSLNINNRLQLGGGLGIYILKNNVITINISDGLIYEYKGASNCRNSTRLKTSLKTKYFNYDGSTYIQPSLLNSNDIVVNSTNNFNFNLKKWISIQITLVNNYVSVGNKENLLYTIGLNLNLDKLYF